MRHFKVETLTNEAYNDKEKWQDLSDKEKWQDFDDDSGETSLQPLQPFPDATFESVDAAICHDTYLSGDRSLG